MSGAAQTTPNQTGGGGIWKIPNANATVGNITCEITKIVMTGAIRADMFGKLFPTREFDPTIRRENHKCTDDGRGSRYES